MKRLTATTALVVFTFPLVLRAAVVTVDVGGTSVAIPEPNGLSHLGPEETLLHELLATYTWPQNYRLATFVPELLLKETPNGEFPRLFRRASVQVEKTSLRLVVSVSQFADLCRQMREQYEQMLADAEKKLPGIQENIEGRVAEEFDVDIHTSNISVIPLTPHDESSSSFSFSVLARGETTVDGSSLGTDFVAGTTTLLHTKDRVLFLYVWGPRDDLEWTRQVSRDWASSIRRANAKSFEEVFGPGRSDRSRFKWKKVVGNAIAAGVLGLVAAVFVGVLRGGRKDT